MRQSAAETGPNGDSPKTKENHYTRTEELKSGERCSRSVLVAAEGGGDEKGTRRGEENTQDQRKR